MMDDVHIQYKQPSGPWTTVLTTMNEPIRIENAMRSLKESNPDFRVRAIDNEGRLVDMLD